MTPKGIVVLRTRVIVAIILIPLVVGCLYLGGIPWLLGVLLAGVLAWLEMAGILQREQFTVDRNLGLFFIVGAIVEAYLHSTFPGQYDLVRPLLAALIIFSLIWALYNKGDHPTADWGVTVASALYLGVTISYLVALRQRSNGFNWAIAAFVVRLKHMGIEPEAILKTGIRVTIDEHMTEEYILQVAAAIHASGAWNTTYVPGTDSVTLSTGVYPKSM